MNTFIVQERDFSFDFGDKVEIFNNQIGHGSYGQVYSGKDGKGRAVAIKKVPLKENGISNVFEANIMRSIIHPNISGCIHIQVKSNEMHLIQELAVSDMAKYTRGMWSKTGEEDTRGHGGENGRRGGHGVGGGGGSRNGESGSDRGGGERSNRGGGYNRYNPSPEQVRNWFHDLANAVYCLHEASIIHADIKAGNVLIFPDMHLKLTDFTLSVKCWDDCKEFHQNSCTCTHRPIEAFLKLGWSYSLDIWSLGCTFYEILHGELLFLNQNELEFGTIKRSTQKVEAKQRNVSRSINAILDWGYYTGSQEFEHYRSTIDYLTYNKNRKFDRRFVLHENLIYQMLAVNPKLRPTIADVIEHNLFQGLKFKPSVIILQQNVPLTESEEFRIQNKIDDITTDPLIRKMSFDLYSCCLELMMSEDVKISTIIFIVHKIVSRPLPIPEYPVEKSVLVNNELTILNHLSFRIGVQT